MMIEPTGYTEGRVRADGRRRAAGARALLSFSLLLWATVAHGAAQVLAIVPSDSPVESGWNFSLTVTYDTAMDTAVEPAVSFPTAGEDASTRLTPSGSTWVDAHTFRQDYLAGNWNYAQALPPIDVAVEGAQDGGGLQQQPALRTDVFEFLYIPPPHVIDIKGALEPGTEFVTPAGSGRVITSADAGRTIVFLIRYDIPTDYYGCAGGQQDFLCLPITLSTPGGTLNSFQNVTSEWQTRNRYKVTWTVAAGDEQYDSVDVYIAGGVGRKDDSGNKNEGVWKLGIFTIDTRNPTVTGVAPAVGSITRTTLGSGSFALTVSFSEPMDTAVAPSLSFPHQDLGAALATAAGSWTDSTHYVQEFVLSDAPVHFPAVDVQVSGAQDLHGNPQQPQISAGLFAIDLRHSPTLALNLAAGSNPSVYGASVSLAATLAGAVNPAGTVAFKDGGNPIAGCDAAVLNGTTATCTTSALAAGTRPLTAIFSGDAANQDSSASYTLVVSKADQTVSFGAGEPLAVGDSRALNATASSGLQVAYVSRTASICTVVGSVVTAVAPGNCRIAASQPGDTDYHAAPEVIGNIPVGPGPVKRYSGPSPTGNGDVTASFTGGGDACGFTRAGFVAAGAAPTGVVLPDGLFEFTVAGCHPGSTLTFTLVYPHTLPEGTQYWKHGRMRGEDQARWYVLPATVQGRQIGFAITDGSIGDDDGAADGSITDPGGPGMALAVPALSDWARTVLVVLIIGVAWVRIGRAQSYCAGRG